MPDPWPALTALSDASRRRLYDVVRRQSSPVSRESAAAAAGMSRRLAAFHLDKLVAAGLLRAWYEAPADQPRGRGRNPKVYAPVRQTLAVSIPERRYELIAEILADAVVRAPEDAAEAARELARRRGRELGEQFGSAGTHLADALHGLGYEPATDEDGVRLDNCPFQLLAVRQTSLVCGLNLSFLSGLLDGLRLGEVAARPVPRPRGCCVRLDAVPSGSPPG